MDIYDEKEQIISSDEYSDDDDDDDALMNDAIRAHNQVLARSYGSGGNIQSKWKIDKKQKELTSLIRRNKISIIYKNKSIKWLNNKRKRERYKEYMHNMNAINQSNDKNMYTIGAFPGKSEQADSESKYNETKTDMVIDVEEAVKMNCENKAQTENESHNLKKDLELGEHCTQQIKDPGDKHDETSAKTDSNVQEKDEASPDCKKVKEFSLKRTRSISSSEFTESKKTNEKQFRTDSPQFYKNINDMFPKYDKVATDHVNTIINSTLTTTEKKMKNLLREIETLDEILHSKDLEWNRLLHLKLVKEEIYSRLCQKRHILQLKENFTKKYNEHSLEELKELELYLFEKKMPPHPNTSSITIQKLIENRANMNAGDLKREKSNTSRLHSLLASHNMLHNAGSSESIFNGEKKTRQGNITDVKSIITDFRQKNSEILPLVGKRSKPNETTAQRNNFSIPLFENSSVQSQCTSKFSSGFYPLRNSVEEVSITPINRVKKMSSSHDIDFVKTMNNNYNQRLEDSYVTRTAKKNLEGSCQKNILYPLCQECKINESRFVCAGCGNQWYCSKNCQISAWDKHSELCTE